MKSKYEPSKYEPQNPPKKNKFNIKHMKILPVASLVGWCIMHVDLICMLLASSPSHGCNLQIDFIDPKYGFYCMGHWTIK